MICLKKAKNLHLVTKHWLTFPHGSVGCSSRLNQTSATAGYFSVAIQLKLRLFFNQDAEIFCGASYFTVEWKRNFAWYTFQLQSKIKMWAVSVWWIKMDNRVIKKRVSITYVLEYDRRLWWFACGVSYVSFHPNHNAARLNELFLNNIMESFLNVPKFCLTT